MPSAKDGCIMWVHLQTSICTAWEQNSMILSPGSQMGAKVVTGKGAGSKGDKRGIETILEALNRGQSSEGPQQKKPKTIHCCILQLHPSSGKSSSMASKLECHVCKDYYSSYNDYYTHLIDSTCAQRKRTKENLPTVINLSPETSPRSNSRFQQPPQYEADDSRSAAGKDASLRLIRRPRATKSMVNSVSAKASVSHPYKWEKQRNLPLLEKRNTDSQVKSELLSLKLPTSSSKRGSLSSIESSPTPTLPVPFSAASPYSSPSLLAMPYSNKSVNGGSSSSSWLLSPLQLPSAKNSISLSSPRQNLSTPMQVAHPTVSANNNIESITITPEEEDEAPLNLSLPGLPPSQPAGQDMPALVPLRKRTLPSNEKMSSSTAAPSDQIVQEVKAIKSIKSLARLMEASYKKSCAHIEANSLPAISLVDHAADQAKLASLKVQLTQLLVSVLSEKRLTEMGYPGKDILDILGAVLESTKCPVSRFDEQCTPHCSTSTVHSPTQLLFRTLRKHMAAADINVRRLLRICVPDQGCWHEKQWAEKPLEQVLEDALTMGKRSISRGTAKA